MSYGATETQPSVTHGHGNGPLLQTPQMNGTGQDVEDEAPRSRGSRFRQSLENFYDRNFGLFLVFLAQTCGSVVRFSILHH